jgi:hypothetical protein
MGAFSSQYDPVAGAFLTRVSCEREVTMPGPLARTRVLMFGSDEPLLNIRAKVLSTIGCDTQVVLSPEETGYELGPERPKPELLILCHSAEDEAADAVRNMALKAGVPTYAVERLIPPQQLLDDVGRLLTRGNANAKVAKVRT